MKNTKISSAVQYNENIISEHDSNLKTAVISLHSFKFPSSPVSRPDVTTDNRSLQLLTTVITDL